MESLSKMVILIRNKWENGSVAVEGLPMSTCPLASDMYMLTAPKSEHCLIFPRTPFQLVFSVAWSIELTFQVQPWSLTDGSGAISSPPSSPHPWFILWYTAHYFPVSPTGQSLSCPEWYCFITHPFLASFSYLFLFNFSTHIS